MHRCHLAGCCSAAGAVLLGADSPLFSALEPAAREGLGHKGTPKSPRHNSATCCSAQTVCARWAFFRSRLTEARDTQSHCPWEMLLVALDIKPCTSGGHSRHSPDALMAGHGYQAPLVSADELLGRQEASCKHRAGGSTREGRCQIAPRRMLALQFYAQPWKKKVSMAENSPCSHSVS